jgi:hypothetical protein
VTALTTTLSRTHPPREGWALAVRERKGIQLVRSRRVNKSAIVVLPFVDFFLFGFPIAWFILSSNPPTFFGLFFPSFLAFVKENFESHFELFCLFEFDFSGFIACSVYVCVCPLSLRPYLPTPRKGSQPPHTTPPPFLCSWGRPATPV